eukprot:GEMP01018840.1.p1 GENE.GEMP01018840.1~~GEMP01018840.1.p1  ORF type:complete len:125 (+),score=4.47 GEMP01018840.1:2338-2712(+)
MLYVNRGFAFFFFLSAADAVGVFVYFAQESFFRYSVYTSLSHFFPIPSLAIRFAPGNKKWTSIIRTRTWQKGAPLASPPSYGEGRRGWGGKSYLPNPEALSPWPAQSGPGGRGGRLSKTRICIL